MSQSEAREGNLRSTDDDDAPTLISSEEAERLKGKIVPENTLRGNEYAVRAFARFLINSNYKEKYFNTEPHLRSIFLADSKAVAEFEARELKKMLFGNCSPNEDLPYSRLKVLNHYIIEFAVHYRTAKQGKIVTPNTMKNYICGLQRAFEQWGFKVNLFAGPVFADKKEGLLSVLDNLFAEQQAQGVLVKGHNVLPREDIKTLLTSTECSSSTPAGYLNRLVLVVGITLGIRPSGMWLLRLSQFTYIQAKGESVLQFTEMVGSKEGASKTKKGGLRAITQKAVKIFIWNRLLLDGTLNVYKDIHEYLTIRKQMKIDGKNGDRFFLQANSKGTHKSNFFRKQVIGKNSFRKIVPNLCAKVGITGTGVNDCVTTHGLRGTMITLLLEAGHADTTIMLRSGHSQVQSVLNYTNLQGNEGLQQQMDMFRDTGSKRKGTDSLDENETKQQKLERTHDDESDSRVSLEHFDSKAPGDSVEFKTVHLLLKQKLRELMRIRKSDLVFLHLETSRRIQ